MQGNWIVDGWRAALSGHTFVLEGDEASGSTYPRSSDADVLLALERLAESGARWRALAERERRARLECVAEAIAREPDPERRFAHRLGLDAAESAALERGAAVETAGAPGRGAGALRGARPDASRARADVGTVLVRCDWSELGHGLARAVLALCAEGKSVLVLSDRAAPMLAEALALALACATRAREPSVPVAVLHDDGNACLQRAVIDPRVRGLSISAPSARLREVERWLNRLQDETTDDAAQRASGAHGFGAGLDEPQHVGGARVGARAAGGSSGGAPAHDPERVLRVLRNASRIVRRASDVEGEARAVVDAAFGRIAALSGQAPGAVGRVLCHERVFSRFTEALLELARHSPDVARPLPLLDPALVEHQRRAVDLGLDEGATPIFSARDASSGASHVGGATTYPVVFTNVEEHMRLAWLGRPAPLLCLLRVESDARAEELAAELDRDPLAEDLSGVDDRPGLAVPPEELAEGPSSVPGEPTESMEPTEPPGTSGELGTSSRRSGRPRALDARSALVDDGAPRTMRRTRSESDESPRSSG